MDGLRALAVLGVIAFHYLGPSGAGRWGWMGVDLFFVLSGYLITGILLASRGRPGYFRTFYARRTLRIFPVYYLLLLTYVVAARVGGGPQPWSYWSMHAGFLSATAEYFHYWPFAAPAFVYAGVTVLWSLSIEEQFYLLWAPLVRFLDRTALWVFLGAVVVLAPALRHALHTPTFPEYRFLPTRFDSLAWGGLLAMARRHWSARRFVVAGTAAAALLLALGIATGGNRANPTFATFGYSLLAAGFAALIGWTTLHAGTGAWLCRALRMRPLVAVGTISYTLYLIHYPILLGVGSVVANPWVREALALAASLATAGLSWRLMELPILRLKNRWAPARGYAAEPAADKLRIEPQEVIASR